MSQRQTVKLDQQVALITGAGRGMGREHALELARLGAAVVVNDIAADEADAVVAEIRAVGGRAVASHHSCGTAEGGAAMVALAESSFGRLDAVVHNAANLRNAPFGELTEQQIDDVLDVNLRAAFFVGQPAFRTMRRQGYGRIVLIGSLSGIVGSAGMTNYSAAKAGLYGLCRGLSVEAAGTGVQVNCVLPRAVTTMADRHANTATFNVFADKPKYLERLTTHSVSVLVAYLCSRACDVTGQMFSATAGRYARVFVGVGEGWLAPDVESVDVDDIAAHWDSIEAHGYDGLVPASTDDESTLVNEMIEGIEAPGVAARTGDFDA